MKTKTTNPADKLKELYSQIPAFKCIPGCVDCCGPVPFAKIEAQNAPVKPPTKSLMCPYASKDGCEIYENRPFICRLYGTIENLQCPRGCRPEAFLDDDLATQMFNEYMRILDGD